MKILFNLLFLLLFLSVNVTLLVISAEKIGTIISMKNNTFLKNKKILLESNNINATEIMSQLEAFISKKFTDYVVKYMYVDTNEEGKRIKEDDQKDIIKNVSLIVIKEMSPIFREKISMIYNDEYIDSIITEIVYMYTMNHVIEVNRMKK